MQRLRVLACQGGQIRPFGQVLPGEDLPASFEQSGAQCKPQAAIPPGDKNGAFHHEISALPSGVRLPCHTSATCCAAMPGKRGAARPLHCGRESIPPRARRPPSAAMRQAARRARTGWSCTPRPGIIQRHEIVLILQRERIAPSAEWMPRLRLHGDRALLGMMREHASQHAAEHGHLSIPGGAGVDGEQSVPFAHMIGKGRLYGIRHPAGLIGRRGVVRLRQDHQRVCRHALRRPIVGVFDPVKRELVVFQCLQTGPRNPGRVPKIVTKNQRFHYHPQVKQVEKGLVGGKFAHKTQSFGPSPERRPGAV